MIEDDICCICLDKVSDDIFYMPCTHFTHKKCIETWLVKKIICPVCRIPIFIQSHEHLIEYNAYVNTQRHSDDTYRDNLSISDNQIAIRFFKSSSLEELHYGSQMEITTLTEKIQHINLESDIPSETDSDYETFSEYETEDETEDEPNSISNNDNVINGANTYISVSDNGYTNSLNFEQMNLYTIPLPYASYYHKNLFTLISSLVNSNDHISNLSSRLYNLLLPGYINSQCLNEFKMPHGIYISAYNQYDYDYISRTTVYTPTSHIDSDID